MNTYFFIALTIFLNAFLTKALGLFKALQGLGFLENHGFQLPIRSQDVSRHPIFSTLLFAPFL